MAARDLYEVLGVAREATADDIKRAYRSKVRECHPDTHRNDPEAESKYKAVNEAYSVLSDPDKRARYDQFGTTDDQPGGNPFGGFNGDFGDIFESFFGGGFSGTRSRPNAPERGNDLQMVLSITLEEAATGVARKITIPRWEPCEHCHGSGSEPGHDPKECPHCHGSGQIRQRVQTLFGATMSVSTCPHCGGRGKIIVKPCTECGGEGRIHRRREQELKVPAGVDNGTRLRVPGAGELGTNGGAPGDLYIVMEVRDNPVFERDGAELHRSVSIPYPLAVLGGAWKAETLIDGTAEFNVPEGTAPGSTIRLRGKGMPRPRGNGRGDMVLHVTIDVPKKSALSETEAALIRQLADEMNISADARDDSILGKIFGSKKTEKKNSKKK